jgi:O-antigen/teichoic acid export membrane protein
MNKYQYQSGALLSYISTVLNVLIGVFFTPFLVNKLGQSEYGLYQMMGSLVSYMVIFDFGLGTTITRYVASYRAGNNLDKMQNFLAICLRIYMLIGVFVLAVCTVVYFNISRIFVNLDAGQIDTARVMFLLLSFNIAASLIFQSFSAVMTGYEKFAADRLFTIIRTVTRCFCITVLLMLGYRAVSIVIVDTAFNIIFCFVRFLFCRLHLKVRFRFQHFDLKMIREIFGFSSVIFISYVIGLLNDQTDRLIVGITCGTAQVSICAVGITLLNLFAQFGFAIQSMVLPKATEIHAAKTAQAELYMRIFIKTGRAQLLVLAAILIGFSVFGQQFVVLWVGKDYMASYWVALILMWAYLIPFIIGAFGQVLTAQNRLKGITAIYGVSAVLNVLISIPLSLRFGAVGSALGTAIMALLGNSIAANIYYSKALGVNLFRFYKSILSGFWITIILASCAGALINLIGGSGWGNLIGKALLFIMFYAASSWFISLKTYEKQYLTDFLRLLHTRKIAGQHVKNKA